MIGDQTLFMRADMVEQAWRIVQPVLDDWAANKATFPNYDFGSSGPEAADACWPAAAAANGGPSRCHRDRRNERRGNSGPRTLAIDIGGTGLKASVLDELGKMVTKRVRVPTPAPCPPDMLLESLPKLTAPLPDL